MTDFDLGDPAPGADDKPDDDQEPKDNSETETASTSEPKMNETSPPTDDMPTSDPSDESDPERNPTETGPAFPYSEVRQNPLYAREEIWTEFEDEIAKTVVPELREMGIRDDELREIHTVALEIVLDNLEEIPGRIVEKRRRSR